MLGGFIHLALRKSKPKPEPEPAPAPEAPGAIPFFPIENRIYDFATAYLREMRRERGSDGFLSLQEVEIINAMSKAISKVLIDDREVLFWAVQALYSGGTLDAPEARHLWEAGARAFHARGAKSFKKELDDTELAKARGNDQVIKAAFDKLKDGQ